MGRCTDGWPCSSDTLLGPKGLPTLDDAEGSWLDLLGPFRSPLNQALVSQGIRKKHKELESKPLADAMRLWG